MNKTIHSEEYKLLLRHLRDTRNKAGLSQEELANRLNITQSFLSKCERGERRIDIIELRSFCNGMGVHLSDFIKGFEALLK